MLPKIADAALNLAKCAGSIFENTRVQRGKTCLAWRRSRFIVQLGKYGQGIVVYEEDPISMAGSIPFTLFGLEPFDGTRAIMQIAKVDGRWGK